MSNKRNDLPVNSGINQTNSDRNHQGQEEYDNLGKDELQKESEVRNTQRAEQMRDSQQGNERMKPGSKDQSRSKNNGRDQHPE